MKNRDMEAPDKAAEREGVDEMAAVMWEDFMAVNEPMPKKPWALFRAGFDAAVRALTPKPTGTEAGRGVGAEFIEKSSTRGNPQVPEVLRMLRWLTADDTEVRKATLFGDEARLIVSWLDEYDALLRATPTPPVSPAPSDEPSLDPSNRLKALYVAGQALINRWSNAPELPEEMEGALASFEKVWLCEMAARNGVVSPAPDSTGPAGAAIDALKFYADPKNWIDTPPWEGDPEMITEKGIPVDHSQDGSPLDCGDRARKALAALTPSSPIADTGLDGAKTDAIQKQCAHYGDLPARCLISERNWPSYITPKRCGLCPDAPAPIAAPVRDDGARERITKWLGERVDAAHRDSEAHPEGSGNRTFYFGQAIAYENALSLIENLPTPASDVPGEAQTQEGGR